MAENNAGRFEGKKFVITGGSGGIGRATAELLAAEGASVLATGTNADKLAAVKGPRIHTLVNDAGSPEAANALAAWVREHFGTVDGVFLNAGYGLFVPHDQVTAEAFAQQYDVNVRGPILHVAVLSPLLKEGGSVVLNTSIASEMGMPGGVLYGSSKAALRNVTRTLAAELAGRKIRVNAISPGPVGTDFFARTGIPEDQAAQMAQGILAQVPLGRFGEAVEIARPVAFLLSDDASFITGAELVADGGMAQV
ncbi:MAG: SDR family oxidoreductase [Myxococcota bacterium]